MKFGDARIIIGFGEEVGTGDISEKINPMIEGLTTGSALYDGIFILRNPENCNVIDYALKDIPIFLPKKIKSMYDICMDFKGLPKKENIKEIVENEVCQLRDVIVNSFLIDPSNSNTHILRLKDKMRKKFSSMWRF